MIIQEAFIQFLIIYFYFYQNAFFSLNQKQRKNCLINTQLQQFFKIIFVKLQVITKRKRFDLYFNVNALAFLRLKKKKRKLTYLFLYQIHLTKLQKS